MRVHRLTLPGRPGGLMDWKIIMMKSGSIPNPLALPSVHPVSEPNSTIQRRKHERDSGRCVVDGVVCDYRIGFVPAPDQVHPPSVTPSLLFLSPSPLSLLQIPRDSSFSFGGNLIFHTTGAIQRISRLATSPIIFYFLPNNRIRREKILTKFIIR